MPTYGLDTVSQIAIDDDWSALRYAKVPMPFRIAAFASFTAYAISNLIGFALCDRCLG